MKTGGISVFSEVSSDENIGVCGAVIGYCIMSVMSAFSELLKSKELGSLSTELRFGDENIFVWLAEELFFP